MRKIQKHQGNELDRISNQNQYLKQLKKINEENVFLHKLCKEHETKLKEQMRDNKSLNEKIIVLEAALIDCRNMIDNKSGQFVKQKDLEDMKDNISRFEYKEGSYKKTIQNLQNIINRTKRKHGKQVSLLSSELTEVNKERILLLSKLKETERMGRPRNLKPLNTRSKSNMSVIQIRDSSLEASKTDDENLKKGIKSHIPKIHKRNIKNMSVLRTPKISSKDLNTIDAHNSFDNSSLHDMKGKQLRSNFYHGTKDSNDELTKDFNKLKLIKKSIHKRDKPNNVTPKPKRIGGGFVAKAKS